MTVCVAVTVLVSGDGTVVLGAAVSEGGATVVSVTVTGGASVSVAAGACLVTVAGPPPPYDRWVGDVAGVVDGVGVAEAVVVVTADVPVGPGSSFIAPIAMAATTRTASAPAPRSAGALRCHGCRGGGAGGGVGGAGAAYGSPYPPNDW